MPKNRTLLILDWSRFQLLMLDLYRVRTRMYHERTGVITHKIEGALLPAQNIVEAAEIAAEDQQRMNEASSHIREHNFHEAVELKRMGTLDDAYIYRLIKKHQIDLAQIRFDGKGNMTYEARQSFEQTANHIRDELFKGGQDDTEG